MEALIPGLFTINIYILEIVIFNEFFKFRCIRSISYNIEMYLFFFQKFRDFGQLVVTLCMTNIPGIYNFKITAWRMKIYFSIVKCIRQEKYRFPWCHAQRSEEHTSELQSRFVRV